jgi:hypothetical protein
MLRVSCNRKTVVTKTKVAKLERSTTTADVPPGNACGLGPASLAVI